MQRFIRFVRLYGPGIVLMLMVGVLPQAVMAQGTPSDLTARSCTLGTTWWDGINRIILGVSVVLFGLAAMAGLTAQRSGSGGGGGEIVGGAIGNVAGVGIILGILGLVGVIAAVARTAAGGYACP